MNKISGVIIKYHKEGCHEKYNYCECKENEGLFIKERFFQIYGVKEGEYNSYYPNGKVSIKCSYINGKV